MTEFTDYQFGKYRIEAEIGRGGFGTVFRAIDTSLERPIALKILDPLLTRDSNWVMHFRKEARVMAKLEHTHIVPIYETGEESGRLYIAMKLIDGPNLAQRVQQTGGALGWEETGRIIQEVASALDYAHNQQIIHRDLKPGNILSGSGGSILTDFGFARLMGGHSLSVSISGGVVGTPAYIAPEIWEGKPVDKQVDIYALGCILYEIVTGQVLFTGDSVPAIMMSHFKPLILPDKWPENVPDGIQDILQVALNREPATRYGSAGEMARDLVRLTTDQLTKPYQALEKAILTEQWDKALQLATSIRAQNPHYRDVQTLEEKALAGREGSQRAAWARQWQQQAETARREGDLKGARIAFQHWQEMTPDDPGVQTFLTKLEQNEAKIVEKEGDESITIPSEPDRAEKKLVDESKIKSKKSRRPIILAWGFVAVVIVACLCLSVVFSFERPIPQVDLTPLAESAPGSTEAATEPAIEEPVAPVIEATTPEVPVISPMVLFTDEVCNSEEYFGEFKEIRAIDGLTVQFTLCRPDPAFLAKLAFTAFAIWPSEYLESTGGTGELLERPIGTGPYAFDTWNRGDSIVFTRNDNYWGEPAQTQTLIFRWNSESAARLRELQAGAVDAIANPSPGDFETINNDSSLQLIRRPALNVFYLGMSDNFTPWNDVRVRRAIAMGIDRQRIVDNFFPPGAEVATHFTPCAIVNGCAGEAWYNFDPEIGRALLAEAGFPDGFQTTIYYRDVFRIYLPEAGAVAQDIQAQLAQNLGIDAQVVVMESGEFILEATSGNLNGLHFLGWGADYPHVTNFLDFHFGQANVQFGDPHSEIYELLVEGAQIEDPAAAESIYAQANNAIRDLVPMVPVAHGGLAVAYRQDVTNADASLTFYEQFAFMSPGDRDQFVWMQNAEPISLYCADETDAESLHACAQVMEGLFAYEVGGADTVPALATACDPNEDLTVWTCALRGGVTFHDGSIFDANDVVMTFSAGLDAANPLHVGNSGTFDYYSYMWGLIRDD